MASLFKQAAQDPKAELRAEVARMTERDKDQLVKKISRYARANEPQYTLASAYDFQNLEEPTQKDKDMYEELKRIKDPSIDKPENHPVSGGRKRKSRTKRRKLRRKSNRRK